MTSRDAHGASARPDKCGSGIFFGDSSGVGFCGPQPHGVRSVLRVLPLERYGRSALALDMTQELRPVVADAIAAGVVNLRSVRPEHFYGRRGGLVLTPEGASNIVRAFERKQAERVRHPRLRVRVTYERIPFLQAQILARYVCGEIREYVPLHTDR